MASFRPRSGETWRDPFPMYAELREEDPNHHVADGDYYVLSRYADIVAAARDTATYSSAQGLTFTSSRGERELVAGFEPMVMQNPPVHTGFRRLVARGFTPKQVVELEPQIRSFVVERIERLRQQGGGDIVAELLKPLPSMVVAHYLGVPEEHRTQFDGWTDAIVAATAKGDPLAAADASAEMMEYFTGLVARRRANPGEDTVSQLVRALGDPGAAGPANRAEDATVTLLQILGFAFTMVTGGNDTTTGLLGGALALLHQHPDQRAQLAADRGLLPDAVEELLRLTSPVQGLARTLTRDVTLHGVTIPAGRRALLLYASGNRDSREHGEDAEELRVGRAPQRILTFSHGAHHCLGAAAARLAGRVTLEELLDRCPSYSVDADAARYADGNYVRRHMSLPFTPA